MIIIIYLTSLFSTKTKSIRIGTKSIKIGTKSIKIGTIRRRKRTKSHQRNPKI